MPRYLVALTASMGGAWNATVEIEAKTADAAEYAAYCRAAHSKDGGGIVWKRTTVPSTPMQPAIDGSVPTRRIHPVHTHHVRGTK